MKKNSHPITNSPADDVQNGIFFDNNPLPMWVYDLETYRFLAVNHAAVAHYGYSEAEFLSMTIKDIRPPEDIARLVENVEHISEGLDEAGTWRHTKKNGSLIFVEIVSHTMQYEGREAELVVAMDVTERRRAEWELSESEKRFHRLAENAPDLIYRYEFIPKRGFTYVSPAATALTGYTPEEHYADPDLGFKLVHPDDRPLLEAAARGETAPGQPLVLRWVRKDGSVLWTEQRNIPVFNETGEMTALEGIARDITERKQAEQSLQESRAQMHGIITSAMDAILAIDEGQRIVIFNPAAEQMFKCPAGEAIGSSLERFIPDYFRSRHGEAIHSFGESHTTRRSMKTPSLGLICLRADGEAFPSEVSISQSEFDGQKLYTAIVRDITERKRAEASLRLQGAALEATVNGIVITDRDGNIQWANEAYAQLTGYTLEEVKGKNPRILSSGWQDKTFYKQMWDTILSGQAWHGELVNKRKDGSLYNDEMSITPLFGENGGITHFIGVKQNITERKRTEETLRQNEDRFRDLVEHIHDLIGTHDLQGNIISINPAASKLLGIDHETIQKMNLRDLLVPEVRGQFEDYLAAIQKNGQTSGLMYVQTANGGRRIWEYDNTLRSDSADGPIVRALARDITERKQAEDALRESEARYRDIFDGVQEAIFVESPDGRILEVNQSACEIYGYTRAEFLAMKVTTLVPEDCIVIRTEGGQISGPIETVNRRANGEVFPVEISGRVETINGEAALLVVVRDITERKQAEEKINLQLQRLSALKEIDRAISSSMDLHVSLDILLIQVLSQLGVDAASVLLLNTSNSLLEFAAGKGYRTPAIRQSRIRLGEGHAGQVGLERRVINIPDLSLVGEQNQRAVLLKDEGFMQYFGVPLVAKGQLKGVLEVFQRSPLQPEAEWMHYLETLGGQAAIAIENAQMFEGLQQSNHELVIAYDATIAGWSHAMDLRDKETEGHTQRVTELTAQLAERMGLGARQIVHIRRGALLHDIGKLGVPDSILLKAGKLTDEEWTIMRRHPALAYEMLSPIAYLKPALDIPYCHHEKWDGTGYPRGLKGEEIPLVARIFAVVDVWDAVTSDRPYRVAWSKEKALEYIRAESGKHFDPKVAETFLSKFEQG